jgi:hypothetical protein
MDQQRVDSNLHALPKLFATDWKMHKERRVNLLWSPAFVVKPTPTLVDGLPVALGPK